MPVPMAWVGNDDPVLDVEPDEAGMFDRYGVLQPCVLHDGAGYKMWYAGVGDGGVERIGLATSADGLVWERYAGNPVLDRGPAGAWDDGWVSSPEVLFDGDGYTDLVAGAPYYDNFQVNEGAAFV